MGDWAALAQSVILGLIFSYLLAKLISIVVTFKPEAVDSRRLNSSNGGGEADFVVAEQGSSRGDSEGDNEDDDWEGVESTQLDEAFSAATAFVATAASDRLSQKVSSDVKQQLYGLYKIATEGPCSAPQPSALKMTARAKWQAWQKLGAMPAEEAMEKYIDLVTQLYPTWLDIGVKAGSCGGDDAASNSKGTMGPIFSSLVYEEESQNELKIDAIHGFAREGEVENLLKSIESGIPVNARDSEGRTPLHWAIDRGHLDIAKVLVEKNADVNAKRSSHSRVSGEAESKDSF